MPSPYFRIDAPGVKAEADLQHTLQEDVAQLLMRRSRSFPGAQPVSFARRHLEELKRKDYYVCEKSDGIRYLLYCTQDNGREIHYLIDRKNDYWFVEGLHFPMPASDQMFHTDTVLDGELVMDEMANGTREPKYLVFDCLVMDQKVLMNRTLDKRIAYFKEMINTPYKRLYERFPSEIQYLPFIMEEKKMEFSYGIEMMFRQVLPSLLHGNDGLIFTCRETEYTFGTDQHILKWKKAEENSIDFRLTLDFPLVEPDDQDKANGITEPWYDFDAMPTCNLMVHYGDNKVEMPPYDKMYLEPEEWGDLKSLRQPLEDRIVECYMDSQKRWRFMKFRDDKKEANHISTVESVIESIEDRVTERDLMAEAKGIRDCWKKRESDRREAAKQNGVNGRPT